MSTDIKLDDNGDIQFADGKLVMVDGIEEVAQKVNLALSTPKGSFLWYTDYGLDMTFIIDGFDEDAGLTAVHDCILEIPEVTGVNNLKCDVDENAKIATFSFSIDSTEGSFTDKKEVPLNAR